MAILIIKLSLILDEFTNLAFHNYKNAKLFAPPFQPISGLNTSPSKRGNSARDWGLGVQP